MKKCDAEDLFTYISAYYVSSLNQRQHSFWFDMEYYILKISKYNDSLYVENLETSKRFRFICEFAKFAILCLLEKEEALIFEHNNKCYYIITQNKNKKILIKRRKK